MWWIIYAAHTITDNEYISVLLLLLENLLLGILYSVVSHFLILTGFRWEMYKKVYIDY